MLKYKKDTLLNLNDILEYAENILTDPTFNQLKNIKEEKNCKVIGYFPVYIPEEIISAGGAIPVGLNGAGNTIELTNADAYFGSFICSIVKSTMELALQRNLDVLDALFFSGICDSARNLCFVIKRHLPTKHIHFFHLPQINRSEVSIHFLEEELNRLKDIVQEITSKLITEADIKRCIQLYNTKRSLISELYRLRHDDPARCSSYETYLLTRLGNFLWCEDYIELIKKAITQIKEKNPQKRDRIKVIIEGAFCEQPPLDIVKIFDDIGFHILDDDFIPGSRIFSKSVEITENPLKELARNYINEGINLSTRHQDKIHRYEFFSHKLNKFKPQAVVFLYAKFCEPGLFDYVIYKDVCKNMDIPYLFIEFEEKMYNFDRIQLELEAFAESLLF